MGNNVPSGPPIFRSAMGVTLVGSGALGARDLEMAMALAPRLVAADGGAEAILAAGLMPEAVLGDMDSLTDGARMQIDPGHIHEIPEQETTDFDKALRHIQAPVVLAAGFTGDRIDHELSVYHALVARRDVRCVVLGARDVVLHAPPNLTLDLPEGTRVSLFPMARVTGLDAGLEWPIEGLVFHPAQRIGTSNRARQARVRLSFDGPGMLLILPRAQLAAVVEAVASASLWSRTGDDGWV